MKSLFLFSLIAMLSFSQKTTNTLILEFGDIQEEHLGKTLRIGYWISQNKSFPDNGNSEYAQQVTIESKQTLAKMQLKTGEYAVSAFIDMNANGKLDKNFFGIPQEPYFLSQNFVPTLSSPDFGDCSFKLDGNQRIKLNMID